MIELQTTWGWEIAIYLFLGGLGAGALCAVAIINLATGERFKNTVRFGAWASVIALAVGTLALLLEVGNPFRAIILFQSFVNFGSWMTIGAWLLLGGILLCGLYALSWTDWVTTRFRPLLKWRTILAIIGIPLCLAIAIYTGVLLGVLPFRPLWNTWFLPALFMASALDTGVALVTAYATLRESSGGVVHLRKVLGISTVILIALEGTILGCYLQTMLSGSGVAALSAQVLTTGALSLLFWVIVVGLGLAVPFLVSLMFLIRSGLAESSKAVLSMLGIVLCLVGGFILRFVVLSAGLPASLSSPPTQQILDGISFIL